MHDLVLDVSEKEKVVLSGASGMLGAAISKTLAQRGTPVLKLVRRETRHSDELNWDPKVADGAIDAERLEGIRGAVHLSGANVATKRWTAAFKHEMAESRLGSTYVLAQTLANLKHPPHVLVAASAIGFYGDRGDETLDESSKAGRGFFPELCTAWEAATRPAEEAGIRVVHLRFGMVIGRDGGAMAKMAPLFRLGLGGRLGSGRQWVSWVSETDAVAAVLFALDESHVSGPVNATSPEPVTNAEFTRELGHAVHRPAVLPAPAFALRLAFGEMADEALLASVRAVPKRLLDAGFVFTHPTLAKTLAATL